VFIIGFSLAAKRFHDLGKSGWHSLLLIIPIYNIYVILGLLLQTGTEGQNQYGDDPLPAEKNHNDFLNKLGRSVIFKIILMILLFALSAISSYENSLAKQQAEQKLQQSIINSLTTNPSSTNNSNKNTTPSLSTQAINTTTSDTTNGWKSEVKNVLFSPGPSVCYTVKYPSNFLPVNDSNDSDSVTFATPTEIKNNRLPDSIFVTSIRNSSLSKESSGNVFLYNYYSKKLQPNVKINTFTTSGGLNAEEFLVDDGSWFIYVAVPTTGGMTNVLKIYDLVSPTHYLSEATEIAKTITASCGH
jgi:preprotein translocase subunit SecG